MKSESQSSAPVIGLRPSAAARKAGLRARLISPQPLNSEAAGSGSRDEPRRREHAPDPLSWFNSPKSSFASLMRNLAPSGKTSRSWVSFLW